MNGFDQSNAAEMMVNKKLTERKIWKANKIKRYSTSLIIGEMKIEYLLMSLHTFPIGTPIKPDNIKWRWRSIKVGANVLENNNEISRQTEAEHFPNSANPV